MICWLTGMMMPRILIDTGAPAEMNRSDACFSAISLNKGVRNMLASTFRYGAIVMLWNDSYGTTVMGDSPVSRNAGHDSYGILSSSLMLVLARVLASTCLTITAQYRLYFPSGEGRFPDTTTEPAGILP